MGWDREEEDRLHLGMFSDKAKQLGSSSGLTVIEGYVDICFFISIVSRELNASERLLTEQALSFSNVVLSYGRDNA